MSISICAFLMAKYLISLRLQFSGIDLFCSKLSQIEPQSHYLNIIAIHLKYPTQFVLSLSLTPVHSDDEDLNLALQLNILDAYPNYEEQYSEHLVDDLDQYYDYDDIQLSSPSHGQGHRETEKKEKRS